MTGSVNEWSGGRCWAAIGLAMASVVGVSGAVEARPVRGPVVRAERRIARALAALDRERAQASARAQAAGQAKPAAPAQAAAQAKPASPTLAAAEAKPAAPTAADGARDVARTAYEAPVPKQAAAIAGSAASREPAADGTVSVLVQPRVDAPTPAASSAAQPGEPLRFPDASAP
jgi:chemosensory pili system protein ChpA (sensor histidine kinase/response regulator)